MHYDVVTGQNPSTMFMCNRFHLCDKQNFIDLKYNSIDPFPVVYHLRGVNEILSSEISVNVSKIRL